MDNLSKATTVQDFFNDTLSAETMDHAEVNHFELVLWDGSERVPLIIEGIDYAKQTIVFADARRFELQRRIEVDSNTPINTLEDAKAYMKDVLTRTPPPEDLLEQAPDLEWKGN
jgi:hypothetical protein